MMNARQSANRTTCKPEKSGLCALYSRLSKDDEMRCGDSISIKHQREILEKFAKNNGFTNIAHFVDDGVSGTTFERDDWQRLIAEVEAGSVSIICVKDLSRFGRNYIETGNYIEKIFPFMSVRFVSVNDGYDSEKNDASDIMVTLRNIVNHAYVTDISRKIKTMFDTKQKNGDFIGWSAPYGYLKSEENNNRLVIDPETASTVKQIFEWKAEGLSYVAIARKFNESRLIGAISGGQVAKGSVSISKGASNDSNTKDSRPPRGTRSPSRNYHGIHREPQSLL